jgi:adenosine deaminase
MPDRSTLSPEMDALLLALPKAELHIHLEGSVQPGTVLALAHTLQLRPVRLQHGFRASEDVALVEYIRSRGIVLDICPTSNVCTNAVASLQDHPLRQLWQAGVKVTLNSDNPPMFHTTLLDEYRLAATHFGFTPAELAQLSMTAIHASLLPSEEKLQLAAAFQNEIDGLNL